MFINQDSLEVNRVQYIDSEGEVKKDVDLISDDDLVKMYEYMILARIFDEHAILYQRQGRIGTYAPFKGQEAAQVGSSFALEEDDWIYPSYREGAAMIVRGRTMKELFLYYKGNLKAFTSNKSNVFPTQIIIAAQTLHAVGGAWASKYKKTNQINVAYIGDGGTSEGDFHEALNLAGVYKLPIIFFVQNNQWAISVPVHKQTASKTIAQKALAYGIEGIQVDGNDTIAVYKTMKEAISKAKEGLPVLIEAITYRHGPHTTADDEKKYRTSEEEAGWLDKDPLLRMKKYLINRGLWDETKEVEEYEKAKEKVKEEFQSANKEPSTKLSEVLKNVYEKTTPQLNYQLDEIKKVGEFSE